MKLTVSELKKVTPDPDRDLVVFDDELRGFGLRMKPSGRTSYFVQYRNRFGRSRRHTFAKGEEMPPEKARKHAKVLLGGVAGGQDPAEEKKERLGTITVRELAKEYLENTSGRAASRARSASTPARSSGSSFLASAAGR